VSPALSVFGHLHGGHGVYEIAGARRKVVLANASILDDQYEIANRPLQFDIEGASGGLSIWPID
jgi:hypothetical protein